MVVLPFLVLLSLCHFFCLLPILFLLVLLGVFFLVLMLVVVVIVVVGLQLHLRSSRLTSTIAV